MRSSVTSVLVAIAVAACSHAPPTPTASRPADTVTEQIGHLLVTHPTSWRAVPGPVSDPHRAVPLFYLSNAPLSEAPCPTILEDNTYTGCPQPTNALPASGVLVTVSPNLGLSAAIPPRVNVAAAIGACLSIGGERSVESVVGGTVIEACLRGPGLDQTESQLRDLISTLKAE